MSTKEITIAGVAFTAPQPYIAGHPLTDGEAKALNQVLAENLRNNFASKVKAALNGAEELTADQKATLDDEFGAYASAYEFNATTVRASRAAVDPVEAEAIKIAKQVVSVKLKEVGKKRSDISDETYNAAIDKVAASEGVLKMARKNVADRKNAASIELDLGV